MGHSKPVRLETAPTGLNESPDRIPDKSGQAGQAGTELRQAESRQAGSKPRSESLFIFRIHHN